MPEDVKFSISLPDGRQTEWDQKQYNKGANTLFEKYPDAQVNRISGYSEQSDLTPDSSFHITLDDGRETDWNYDQFSKGRETLLKKYPNAKISVTDDITAQRNRDFAHQYEFAQSKVDDINMPDSEKQPYIDFVGQHAERYDKVKDKYGNQYNGRPDGSDRLVEIYSRMEALQKELEELPQERDYRGLSREEAVLYAQEANSPQGRRRSEIKKELEQLRKERETNPAWQAYWNKTEEDLPGLIDAMDAKAKEYANVGGRSANMSDQEALDLIGGAEEKQGNEQERDYYLTARKYYKEALETAKAPSKYDDSWGIVNFAKGAGANIASAVSILELAKSLQDVNLINTVKQIQQAEGKDVNLIDLVNNESDKLNYLSDGQKEMLKAFAKRYEVEQGRSDNMSIGYNAGKGAITSLGFMGDFLVTGGLGEAAGKAVAKKLAKTTTEEIAGKTLGAQTKKLLVGNLEGATKALVMTPMMPSSYANFINNLTQLNADGQMDLSAKAVGKAIEDGLIETFSENAGQLFGIPFEGKIFDGISKSKLGEVGKAMSRTGAGQFLKQAGWHGLVGEMAEEVLGNAMRSALNVDENALKDFFSGDQFWTTLASFAPMSIVGAGSSAIQIRKAGRQMSKYGDQLKTILNNLGLNENQMGEVEDRLGAISNNRNELMETPEALGSEIAKIGKMVGDTGLLTNDIAPDLGMAMGQYLQAAAQYKVLRGIFDEEQDIARAQNTALLDEQVGNKSWYHEGEDGANYVRTITDAEGNERFVVNSLDGQYALIGKDGSYSFLTNEELEAGIADGSLTDSGEQPINSYLDGIAENEQRTSEQERMAEETASQISAIQQRIAENPSFNIGTEEAPITASVTAANENGVRVVWTDSDGQNMAQDLTWEQVGNYLGTPVEVKTDEQIEDEEVQAEEDIRSRKEDYNKTIPEGTEFTAVLVEGEEPVTYQFKRAFINEDGTMMLQVTDKETGKDEQITEEMALQGNLTSVLDSFKTPAEVQQEEAVAEEETPVDDGVLRDFRGNPIPLKDDGSVNQTALWNADPEAWAKWNDSQRNDGGANSRGYIAKAMKKLQSDAKAVQKQIAKELDFDKIESLEGQLAGINNRIADLERIENNYANAEVAQAEVEQTPEEVPAPVAPVAEVAEEAPVAETVPEVQEEQVPLTPDQVLEGRLAEAKTPEEKRQALEEYYALTTTDPTVVGTRADILQRMEELGFSERVIGQVRDQLNDKGELTEGFHIGSMVFIVADDIRDARRARLAHLHEHWHEINRQKGYHRTAADIPGVTTEYLLDVANKMAGITKGEGYSNYLNYPNPQQALADEVIALSMEVVAESTTENVDENLRNAGLDNQEIINFVKTIYNGERGNDQTLDSSGRDTLSGDNAQEGERQDGGDIQPQPEGILGEQGSGSEERSIQGAGEGGLDTSGNPEVTPPLAPFVKEGDKLTSYIDAPTGQKSPSAPDETMFSLKREEDSKDDEGKTVPGLRTLADGFLAKLADKPLTPEELAIGSDAIGEMVNYMMPYLDMVKDGKRYLPEEIFGKGWSTIFKNGSYGRTMENTLICMRTLAYNDFVNAVQEKVGRPLTPTESFLASQMLYDIATDPQCLYCYVALDRKAYNGFLKTYIEQRDAVLDKYKADDTIDRTYRLPAQAKSRKSRKGLPADNQVNKLYLEYLDGRADTPSMRNRFNGWLDRIAEGSLIGMKDLTSPETRQKVAAKGASYASQIDDAERYAQSASWAKKQEEYRAYNGELLSMPQKVVDLLNSEYGLRFYSFSEYSPAFIVENMQMVRDAALRGLVGLAYTKEIDFAKIFAPTGININISCYGREAEDGTVVMDTKQGADWGEAQALREKYGNVGCVFVATNDRMVEWAIHQPWVDVVIPFHIVRTGEDIAKFYDWTNYTSMEADKDAKGRSRDIMPTEHMNDKDTFLKLCEERGLKPRFADLMLPSTGRSVTEDPDYMKLVNETRRSVNETVRIKPIFDTQEARRSFDEFVEKGGYYAGWFTEEGAFERGVEQVAADVEAGKTAKDVDYGRQDIKASAEKLAAMAGKRKRPRSHQGTPRRIGDDTKKLTKAQQNVLNYLDTGEFKSEREPLEAVNATQKQPVSEAVQPVVTEEDVMFRLSKNNKATVESWLKKREDINDEQRAEVVDYIDKLDDAKTQLATAKWFANGTIRIPEDMKKVQQAISVAGKAKVDPLRYNSPMELLDAHAEFKPSEERINPDEVSTLHRTAEYPDYGIVVYDVDSTKESRENMRKIINTHFGEDASPWCLLQGDGKGNLTADSARYWKHYSAIKKQVAFKDGKLLAFSANDKQKRLWWDRKDESHYGIPVTQKIEGDELGRSANFIIDDSIFATEKGQLVKEPGSHLFRGNKQNGVYEEWSTDGSTILERTNYKNGEEDGLTEAWYPNGQMQRRTTMKNGNYAGRYEAWFDNGQKQVDMTLTEEGFNDGERKAWWKNGNLRSEGRYKNSKRVGEHRSWDEDGNLESVQYYSEDADYLGFEDHNRWGINRRVTYTDDAEGYGQIDERFYRGGRIQSIARTKNGKLEGMQEYFYADGVPQTRSEYSKGERNGIFERYHPNGKLMAKGEYKNGEREGIQELYDKYGDLISRQEYHNDEKVRELPLDENVQFRLSNSQQMDQDYMAAVEAGDMDTAQRMVDEMAEAAGYTIRGYHGTTHDFTIFDRSKGNAEGNWGKGFYFTNNEDDAEVNYAGEGPDLTNRIELLAENMEWMDGYEGMDYEQRLEEARKQLAGDNPHVISAAIKMENPVVFDSRGGQQETYFDYNENYNEETEEYEGEPTGRLVDFVDAWNDVLTDWEWEGNNVSPAEILEYANYEGLTASQLEDKAREILAYVENSEGQIATGEFLRQVFERMGFDGIVDNNVNMKFGSQRRIGRGMDGMDYGTTHVIAFNSNQIKQTDPVTYDDEGNVIPLSKRFDSWNEDIRFRKANQTQNGFISNAEAALDKIKMDKATPEQWVKMLEKEGGLKAGEDKWLGLSDWLKASDKKTLTKDEIADFIEQNRIQIEEQRYSEMANLTEERDAAEALQRYQDEFDSFASDYINGEVEYAYLWPSASAYAFEQMAEKYGDDFRLAFEVDGNTLAPMQEFDDDFNGATRHFLGLDTADVRRINPVRLDYTTPGLDNKAEIALTIPTIDSWNESDMVHFGDAGEGRAIAWIRFGDAFQDGSVMTEEEKEGLPDYYKGREIRRQPKRVLVIDEIQSKRHQEAREKGGYTDENTSLTKEARDKASKEWEDYSKELRDKYKLKDDITYVLMQKIHDKATPEEFQKAARLNQAVNTAQEEWRKVRDRVPAAPFEKNWHELAMKRMLRLAAEEGYDKIAWTTGDQQAERYNIGNVVNKIEAGIDVDGNRLAFISFREGGTLTVRYDDEGNITGLNGMHAEEMGQVKHLSDIVGKEIAKDALTINERGSANLKTYEGEGLRIGGEGMKGFYDDILPRFMNKYGKKWGVKVQDIELPEIGYGGLTMHSVDVTPEMKESVMEGQVMFRLSKEEGEAEVDKFRQKYNSIAPIFTMSVENDSKRQGLYSDGKIVIFVNKHDDTQEVENTCFHENIHAYVDKEGITEDQLKKVGDFLLIGLEGKDLEEYTKERESLKAEEVYKDIPEQEFVCRLLSENMQTEQIDALMQYAEAEEPEVYDLINDFFKQLQYDARKESEARAAQEDSDAGSIEEVNERGGEEGDREYQEGSEEIAPVDEFGDAEVLFRLNQDAVQQSREGGLTGVIGDENAAELYRNVYKAVPKEIRQQIVDKAGDSYLFSEATKNMISEAVEKGDKTGIAGLAANMLRDYAGDLDERTARYILWRGDRKVEDDDLLDTVNDIAMQRRLKVGQFAEQPMFRLADNIEDAENRAESMADDAKATLNENKEFAKVNDALTTIKAMSLQKEYDRKTVNTITVLAKNVLKDQSIETLSRHEIARLLGIVTTSIGKAPKTVKKNADALIDMILGHMLKSEETKLGMLASVRATKTNTTGVEVQGELDVRGQNVLKAYKAGLDMDLENPTDEYDENTIKGRLSVLNERLESTDDAVRSEAEDEIAGLMLAQEYQEKVKASINEERGIKNEMKDAAEQLRDGKISRTAYNEFVTEAENSIRENRIERIDAYQSLRAKMVSMMAGSIDARKEFTEREKQRVEEIHHLANSDMQGKIVTVNPETTRTSQLANSDLARVVLSPFGTFDQMLRLFGEKNVAGEGYLWNKYMRGWIEASERAYLGEKEAKTELDEKVSEVFDKDMRWSDLYAEERKMPKVKVRWWDGGEMKEHELTQGNLLYIYMVNKMTDGRMKLRRMGITQATVDAIKRQMDDRFLELADWVQERFLTEKRNKYNSVHERLFGASMAAIEDYFPLRINKNSLSKAEDIGRPDFDNALLSTSTGSIIKRKRNAQDLDLLNTDAFSVVIEHIEEMEKWAAFAEFNRDINTLLSYKRFRNQVQNMTTVYGSGKEFWDNFKAVCSIAGGTYRAIGKRNIIDRPALNLSKGLTAAKIAFRPFTALKQLLSMPAYLPDANIRYFGENLATPWKAWNWAMENLPLFEKRWKSRIAGDTRLMNTKDDWKSFRTKIYDWLSKYGMLPNAFVDALTVSIGARSIYQTRYDRYIKDGYTEEEADKKAKQDATILFNETQQSSESAFVSQVQIDRTAIAAAVTVFRNSSMGYQRQLHDALRNADRILRKEGYKAASIEFMKKQMMRDGLTEEQAQHAAERNYNREKYWRSAVRIATFGFLMQFFWNLGPNLAYLLFGGDDDKKDDALKEAALHAILSGSVEGFAYGNIASDLINMIAKGEKLSDYDPTLLPIVSDFRRMLKYSSSDPIATANDLVNIAVQAGLGVNPQTLTDAIVAVIDACGGDLDTSKEALLLIMRVMQVPQSQIDQIYIDELGENARSARKMSPKEMADRYVKYKISKGAPLTGWAYSDEAEEKKEQKYLKNFNKLVKERNSKK